MAIRLVVVEGPETGRQFDFTAHATFLVGRGDEAHFRLSKDDRHCSRLHFMVEVNPPLCKVWDMESNNGTFVNGTRVAGGVALKNGDRIKAGRTLLQVVTSNDRHDATLDDVDVVPPSRPVPPPLPAIPVVEAVEVLVEVAPHLPGYRLENELGRGGLGVVYRAVRLADGAKVAVKLIRPGVGGEPARRAFLRDVAPMRLLDHRRIVRCLAVGAEGALLFVASELVERATTLADLLRERGPLPVPVAVGVAGQALEGLAAGHKSGWVHRDVKPSNLLLGPAAGGKLGVKVADFGLARVYQASPLGGLSVSDEEGASPPWYAAPEALTDPGTAVAASDQYGVAVVLYELLTGKRPFPPARTAAQAYSHVLLKPPTPVREVRPDLPAGLEKVLARALEKKPAARFSDAAAFAEALRPFTAG